MQDAAGNITSNSYDVVNRRILLFDPNNKRTTFLYDLLGRDLGSIDPLGRIVTFAYDFASRRTLKLDPRGNRITYSYDAANRLTGEQHSDGTRFTYTYDFVGNRLTAAGTAGIFTTAYDMAALERVVRLAEESAAGQAEPAELEAALRDLSPMAFTETTLSGFRSDTVRSHVARAAYAAGLAALTGFASHAQDSMDHAVEAARTAGAEDILTSLNDEFQRVRRMEASPGRVLLAAAK